MKKQFSTKVGKLEDSRVYMHHIIIPEEIASFYKEKKHKRLLCQVNDLKAYSSAILNLSSDYYYINLNKTRMKQLGVDVGDKVEVSLEPDTSEYGMPMPLELKEIFAQDQEADRYFHKLTPGKQRTLLYLIGKFKSQDKRIEKAIIMTNYLKRVKGALDFKELNIAFKEGL